jgi:hypothetical protein
MLILAMTDPFGGLYFGQARSIVCRGRSSRYYGNHKLTASQRTDADSSRLVSLITNRCRSPSQARHPGCVPAVPTPRPRLDFPSIVPQPAQTTRAAASGKTRRFRVVVAWTTVVPKAAIGAVFHGIGDRVHASLSIRTMVFCSVR